METPYPQLAELFSAGPSSAVLRELATLMHDFPAFAERQAKDYGQNVSRFDWYPHAFGTLTGLTRDSIPELLTRWADRMDEADDVDAGAPVELTGADLLGTRPDSFRVCWSDDSSDPHYWSEWFMVSGTPVRDGDNFVQVPISWGDVDTYARILTTAKVEVRA